MSNDSLMNCARKPLLLLIATLAPFLSGPLRAAGFGELVVHSSLGEPLRAEIGLVRVPGKPSTRVVSRPR
jgi:Tfp pilus assembly protein FimV